MNRNRGEALFLFLPECIKILWFFGSRHQFFRFDADAAFELHRPFFPVCVLPFDQFPPVVQQQSLKLNESRLIQTGGDYGSSPFGNFLNAALLFSIVADPCPFQRIILCFRDIRTKIGIEQEPDRLSRCIDRFFGSAERSLRSEGELENGKKSEQIEKCFSHDFDHLRFIRMAFSLVTGFQEELKHIWFVLHDFVREHQRTIIEDFDRRGSVLSAIR